MALEEELTSEVADPAMIRMADLWLAINQFQSVGFTGDFFSCSEIRLRI